MAEVIPARHQPHLPVDRFIVQDPPDDEHVPLDVVFVGAGPAGLAGALELARLVREANESDAPVGDVEIGVLEKAESLGEHNLSGAVVNPRAFQELFPDVDPSEFPFRLPVEEERVYLLGARKARRIPTPAAMRNHGNYIASICEIVRWLGERAEEAGINVFTGFPAQALLADGQRVIGVRTAPSGLDRDGQPGSGYAPPTDIVARFTVLSEGTRGTLSQAFQEWQGIKAQNPQIYALGVKEVWETKTPPDAVVHTMGWPLPRDAFGGSFMYAMAPNILSIGLVVGMDYRQVGLDVHDLFQRMKTHPLFRPHLEGGEMLEWGAKTIPEGGYYSLPDRLSGDGILVVGDAAGFVDVPSLKGIHYAMQSGIQAARTIFDAIRNDDASAARLAAYDHAIRESYVVQDLHRTRNMRLAFKDGFFRGGFKAALMSFTRGAFPGRPIAMERDVDVPKETGGTTDLAPDGRLTFSKVDAVFKSGNQTRDDIPSHLIAPDDAPEALVDLYAHMCPAGVYEQGEDGGLVVNAPNCIDCKATDVLGPRWTPREGGSGPRYRQM